MRARCPRTATAFARWSSTWTGSPTSRWSIWTFRQECLAFTSSIPLQAQELRRYLGDPAEIERRAAAVKAQASGGR